MGLSQATVHALQATGMILFPVCSLAVALLGPFTRRKASGPARGMDID